MGCNCKYGKKLSKKATMCLKLFWSWSCIEIFIIYQLLWNFTATMEIFDVEANNFEFYFKKIGSIVSNTY